MQNSATRPVRHRRLQDIAGLTDIGLRRRNNEDAIAWDAELGLALVADGVGGHNGGEVASSTAVRSIKSDLHSALRIASAQTGLAATGSRAALVQELIRRANQRIASMAARDPKLHGMGATLALTLLVDDQVVVANVGDSRVYRLRCAALEQLTRDHLLTQELLQNDHLTAEQAQASGNRNMLSRALGMAGGLEVDLAQHPAESGDLYLLCSDGLTGMIGDQELAALLNDPAADLRELAHQAVELAKRRGGRDNISIVLMRLA